MIKRITLHCKIPKKMSNDRVCELIETLLNIGLSDAADTVESEEGDCFSASEALTIDVQHVEVSN